MEAWLNERRPKYCENGDITNGEEMSLCRVGSDLYEKIFKHYTKKQWDKYPKELDASVLARLPVRKNREDRYFNDPFEGLPQDEKLAFHARFFFFGLRFRSQLHHPLLYKLLLNYYLLTGPAQSVVREKCNIDWKQLLSVSDHLLFISIRRIFAHIIAKNHIFIDKSSNRSAFSSTKFLYQAYIRQNLHQTKTL